MKNIVICCDGTSAEYSRRNTNIVKLYQSVIRDSEQIAFYDPGVGTFSFLGREVGRRVGIVLGKAFGAGLQQNIEDAYRYLMDRYQPGDRVFLFGFSRGAFTVRALAGMLHKCGLLQKGSNNLIPYASKIYNRHDNDDIAAGFKETYSHECKPYFIGVWDTVGSMGWFWGSKFFDTYLNEDVTYGYQAVSTDERRRHFPVSLWNESRMLEHQTIVQVWFPGFHSDVGGSHPDPGISDITLKWMLENARDKGLRLKEGRTENLNPNPHGQIDESWKGVWRIWSPTMRRIPEFASIHSSVFKRMENPANRYQPRNLPAQYHEVE